MCYIYRIARVQVWIANIKATEKDPQPADGEILNLTPKGAL
mgnify:CR=1 FL=1